MLNCPPRYRVAGNDVLADRFLEKPLAGLDVGLVDEPAHAAVMVDMRVAVEPSPLVVEFMNILRNVESDIVAR